MGHNNSQGKNRHGNNRNKPSETKQDIFSAENQLEEPLFQYFSPDTTRGIKLYLPEGEIYKTAKSLERLTTSQLRKVLDMAKEALAIGESDEKKFGEARQHLFMILPMVAYNTGRAGSEKEHYKKLVGFLYKYLNEATIQSMRDIKLFDKMITALVAYHKLFNS